MLDYDIILSLCCNPLHVLHVVICDPFSFFFFYPTLFFFYHGYLFFFKKKGKSQEVGKGKNVKVDDRDLQ